MKQAVVTVGVFLIAAVCLFGLFSVSVSFNDIAKRPGTEACFHTTCQ